MRIAGLIERDQVPEPHKILVATFTNTSRDNIRDRLVNYLRPADLRARVTVHNFHGLAARIYRAHANIVGMDPLIALPDRDWVKDQCRTRELNYDQTEAVENALRGVKHQALDDAQVLDALVNHPTALSIEEVRQAENRLTYDDLLRLAELILRDDAAANLYRNHFGCVIVDEFQDLTPQQLRVIQRLGYGRTTYAGDMAQGIYSFAGAAPREVMATIRAEVPRTIPFAESHRSSPAVLAMVNALSAAVSGQSITCATPHSWPGGGLAARLRFATTHQEASWALTFARFVLSTSPTHRVAIIARTKNRRRFMDDLATDVTDIGCYRWDDPVLDSQTAPLVRAALTRVQPRAFDYAEDRLAYLWQIAGGSDIQDPDTRESLVGALGWVFDLLMEVLTPGEIGSRIRIGDGETLITKPGLHLLTGHIGKGQQFDWVIIIGMEEGRLPFFKAKSPHELEEEARVLSVMISRARHGIVLTRATKVPTLAGTIRSQEPSSLLAYFVAVPECRDEQGLAEWLTEVDWSAVALR